VARYGFFSEQNVGLIFRLKPLNRFIELRICDYWFMGSAEKQPESTLRKALGSLIREIRPLAVTWCQVGGTKTILGDWSGLISNSRLQPSVTIRPLAMQDLSDFQSFSNWQPSLGAMELF
jgi:hypothetical protein